jgi:Protein of unknown function (DUF2997)
VQGFSTVPTLITTSQSQAPAVIMAFVPSVTVHHHLNILGTNGGSTFRVSAARTRRCGRSPQRAAVIAQTGQSTDYEGGNTNYGANGMTGSFGMQRIEYIIRPDGRVEEKVTGVRGKCCEEVTARIHEALGKVTHTEKTEEYFEQEIVTEKNINKNGADPTISSW